MTGRPDHLLTGEHAQGVVWVCKCLLGFILVGLTWSVRIDMVHYAPQVLEDLWSEKE